MKDDFFGFSRSNCCALRWYWDRNDRTWNLFTYFGPRVYCDTWLWDVHRCTVRRDCEVYTGVLWDTNVRCTQVYCVTWLWGIHSCTLRRDCEMYTGVYETWLWGIHRCTVRRNCEVYTGLLWDVTVRCTQVLLCDVTVRCAYTDVLWDVTVRYTQVYFET